MTAESNRLWACKPTESNLEALGAYPHSKASSEYCLIISPSGEDWMVEISGGDTQLLTARDWQWILSESEKIRREEEIKYHDELMRKQDEFLRRFAEELAALKETSEEESSDGGNAGTAE